MKILGRIALIALMAAVAGCSGSRAPYTSAAGNFRADMPTPTKEMDREIPSPLGGNLKMLGVTASDSNNVAYSVLYCDYPPGIVRPDSLERVLDGVASGFIRGSGFRELETKRATLYGQPGREVFFEVKSSTGAKGCGRSRILLDGDRLYQIIVAGPDTDATRQAAESYFKSFALLNKPAPTATPAVATPTPPTSPSPAASPTPATSPAASPLARAQVPGWGSIIDPLNDCTIDAKPGELTITVPGTAHDFNPPPSRFDAPRVLADVQGDFSAEVEVPDEPRPSGKSVGTGLPFHGAGLVVSIDDKNFVRLERAGILRGESNQSYALFEGLNQGQKFGHDGIMPPGSTWLRLQRKGAQVTAFTSTDGQRWNQVGGGNVNWPPAAKVGVMAVNSADRPYTARFRGLKITQP